jgi:hypothetical protein
MILLKHPMMGTRAFLIFATASAALAFAGPSSAVETEQICQAATVHARAANAEVGLWLDRHTRHDGVEVVCNIRTVQFRRFVNAPEKGWQERKATEWNSINCSNRVWRLAIDEGWMIVGTFTTASGERADVIASCN